MKSHTVPPRKNKLVERQTDCLWSATAKTGEHCLMLSLGFSPVIFVPIKFFVTVVHDLNVFEFYTVSAADIEACGCRRY